MLAGRATLPLVTLLALGLSLASAFSIPAGTSMLPHAVAPQHLQAANGMMMAIRQVTMLLGPLLAGLLFVLAGDGGHGVQDARGLGLAFGVDCFSFVLSAWTLSRVRPLPLAANEQTQSAAGGVAAPAEPLLRAVGAGVAAVWRDLLLRTAFLYWGLCACVVGSVMQVALPLLASNRLHGASALALLAGAHGAGTLAGMAVSGVAGKRRIGKLGTTLLLLDGATGLLLPLLGMATTLWQGAAVLLAIGMLGGFATVAVFTWLQQRAPRAMLGRVMGIFMFVIMGLTPLGAAVAGWLATLVTLDALFAGAGLFLAGAALLAWLLTPMRSLSDASAPGTPGAGMPAGMPAAGMPADGTPAP